MSGAMLEKRQLGRRQLLKLGLIAGLMGLAKELRSRCEKLIALRGERLLVRRRSWPIFDPII